MPFPIGSERSSRLFPGLPLLPPLAGVAASWMHFWATGSIHVDGNYLEAPGLILVNLLLFFSSIVGGTWVGYRVSVGNGGQQLSEKTLRWWGYGLLAVSSAMLPFVSNDVFSVLGYGDASLQGLDVYRDASASVRSRFADFISPAYLNVPCKYGPVNLLLAKCAVWLGVDLWGSLLVYKALTALAGIVFVESILRLRPFWGDWDGRAFALFSPLWWFQGIGQQHNDVFGVAFLALCLLALQQRRYTLAWATVALAFLCKATFVVLLPVPFAFALVHGRHRWGAAIRASLPGLAVVAALFLFSTDLLPSLRAALAPLRPSSSFSDLLGYVVEGLGTGIAKEQVWSAAVPVFQLLGLLALLGLAGRTLWKLNETDEPRFVELFVQLFVVFVCLYSNRFLPWYLLTLLPLFALGARKTWREWMMWTSLAANLQDGMHIPSTETAIGRSILIGATVATVGLFLWKTRERFWPPTDQNLAKNPLDSNRPVPSSTRMP
jgi:hypothetical protein